MWGWKCESGYSDITFWMIFQVWHLRWVLSFSFSSLLSSHRFTSPPRSSPLRIFSLSSKANFTAAMRVSISMPVGQPTNLNWLGWALQKNFLTDFIFSAPWESMKLKKEKVPWKKMRISVIKETWRRRMLGKGENGEGENIEKEKWGEGGIWEKEKGERRKWRRGKFRKVHGERGE